MGLRERVREGEMSYSGGLARLGGRRGGKETVGRYINKQTKERILVHQNN